MTERLKLEILARTPFAGGHAFGEAGAYERIDARAHIALDPKAAEQRFLHDIDLAPRGKDGLVHFESELFLLRPVDLARGNGALFVEFPNRGNKRCLQFFNDAPGSNDPRTAAHAGNGFLLRQGYTVAILAWQGDVLPGDNRLIARLPVASDKGKPVTARIRAEFITETTGVTVLPLSGKNGTRALPAVSLDTSKAEFRRRRYPWTEAKPIPAGQWQFARVEGGGRGVAGDITGAEQAVIPSDGHIYLPAGFEPGWIYELVYEARDPLVLDLGLAAAREIISFLRHETSAANPVRQGKAGPKHILGWGRSQSGRVIREFIHRGFNVDPRGGKVFDGLVSHVAGGGLAAMQRFSNLVLSAPRQYEDQTNPADRFPFAYASSTDHITGVTDAILKRPDTDPLVIHTQTATEYWGRRGSLVHTDSRGNDLPVPPNARIYFWSSSQHWADPQLPRLQHGGPCRNYQNSVATSAFFRSILTLMLEWVRDGRAPPESLIPRRADGTLATMPEWRKKFPAIPGVALPHGPNELPFFDYGEVFAKGGPVIEPPKVDSKRSYGVQVPAVDDNGNDAAGLRAPMVEAPLATYTGWNQRIAGQGAGALHEFSGSTIPFPETAEERRLSGDPRASIIERYRNRAGYVAAIRRAAEALEKRRFMLAEDVERAVAVAANWGAPRHIVHLTADDELE